MASSANCGGPCFAKVVFKEWLSFFKIQMSPPPSDILECPVLLEEPESLARASKHQRIKPIYQLCL